MIETLLPAPAHHAPHQVPSSTRLLLAGEHIARRTLLGTAVLTIHPRLY
jgi:hypothetical protein